MPSSRLKAFALFLGLAAGFIGAVLAGRRASHYQEPANFVRFHPFISPESLYFPTFTNLENLALARWHPGQTVVIIGGNSILNGVGQPEKDVWSEHLQSQLGERFVVVNLSFRGGQTAEGGALVAESLLRRNVPVVLVSNTAPGSIGRAFDNYYNYLFWQAWALDRLLPYTPREEDIAAREQLLNTVDRAKRSEQRLGARLDSVLHFQALWQHVAYRDFFTVWSFLLPRDSWRPRDYFPDREAPAAPLATRFMTSLEIEMDIVRACSASTGTPDGQGGWKVDDGWLQVASDDIAAVFPDALRPHMLVLLNQNCPFYRDRLTPAERARDTAVYTAYLEMWRENGIACITAGADFDAADFRDRAHLVPSGGKKLAQLVAAEILRLENH